jgi:peptidoglycan/LPS O-acetylase OafA/YrhL
LIIAAFRGRVCSRLLALRWVTDIGGMCYTIYLLHFLLLSGMGRIFKPFHIGNSYLVYYLTQAVIVLPLVLVACMAYFLLIERPCMDRNWPSKFAARFRMQKEKIQTLI